MGMADLVTVFFWTVSFCTRGLVRTRPKTGAVRNFLWWPSHRKQKTLLETFHTPTTTHTRMALTHLWLTHWLSSAWWQSWDLLRCCTSHLSLVQRSSILFPLISWMFYSAGVFFLCLKKEISPLPSRPGGRRTLKSCSICTKYNASHPALAIYSIFTWSGHLVSPYSQERGITCSSDLF